MSVSDERSRRLTVERRGHTHTHINTNMLTSKKKSIGAWGRWDGWPQTDWVRLNVYSSKKEHSSHGAEEGTPRGGASRGSVRPSRYQAAWSRGQQPAVRFYPWEQPNVVPNSAFCSLFLNIVLGSSSDLNSLDFSVDRYFFAVPCFLQICRALFLMR